MSLTYDLFRSFRSPYFAFRAQDENMALAT